MINPSATKVSIVPYQAGLGVQPGLYDGKVPDIELRAGLTVLVGPNAAGKTVVLRALKDRLRELRETLKPKHVVYLAAGRSMAFEQYRSSAAGPNQHSAGEPAAVGHRNWMPNWWQVEGAPGMIMRLKDRPDLLLKVQARLQALHERRLRLEWSQSGLQVAFVPTTGGNSYFANVEASGLIQLVPLLAALYDDEIFSLLIDEPEISLHPQLQAFILQEMSSVAGDPAADKTKKLIVIATHSPSMLPVRRIADITRLVFFIDRQNSPIQVPGDAGELKNRKLAALIARMTENHKLAFFARNVLLVEGPSDEIIVSGLALKLDHPLLGGNTQVVPITGKGQFPQSIKLFTLMGKRVFVMADLDALADSNDLINCFQVQASSFILSSGFATLAEMDKLIRRQFISLIDTDWARIEPEACKHRYWTKAERGNPEEETKAKRRAALAALLAPTVDAIEQSQLGPDWLNLRKRYDAQLEVLERAGCVVLRRGTLEDYFLSAEAISALGSVGKPEGAAIEVEYFSTQSDQLLKDAYADIVAAIQISAPINKIDENDLLKEQLGALLGAALLFVTPKMSNDELNARAAANFGSDKPVFKFANRTKEVDNGNCIRRINVEITSPLFHREAFPFEIDESQNPTVEIERRLPRQK